MNKINFVTYTMKSLNEALEMEDRQKDRHDEVEIVADKEDGVNVYRVLCADKA